MKIFSISARNLTKILQTLLRPINLNAMRTILSQKIPKRSLSSLIAVLLLAGTVSLGTACDDDKDFSRREHIEWSTTPDFEIPAGTLHVPVRFSETTPTASYMTKIYIKANVEYQAPFETDEEETEPDWIRIAGINRNVRPGIDELELEIDAHPGAYEERKGCISLITGAEYRTTRAGNRPRPRRKARPIATAKTAISNSATVTDTAPA